MIRFCLGEQIVSKFIIDRIGNSSGFSLIEVLVASTVFSLGLAGLAALLLVNITGSADARRESFAAMAAASLAEQIRLNPVALNQYLSPPENISSRLIMISGSGKLNLPVPSRVPGGWSAMMRHPWMVSQVMNIAMAPVPWSSRFSGSILAMGLTPKAIITVLRWS